MMILFHELLILFRGVFFVLMLGNIGGWSNPEMPLESSGEIVRVGKAYGIGDL